MFDLNTLPLPSGVVLAGLVWGGASALILGPLIAERSIERLDWPVICEAHLRDQAAARTIPASTVLNPSCSDLGGLADTVLGAGAGQALCQSGAGQMLDQMSALSTQMETARQVQARLASEAEVMHSAPLRYACAANAVRADTPRE